MKIKGKTALVLGAAKGIGKAIAAALARQGARVAVTYYDWPEDSELMKPNLPRPVLTFWLSGRICVIPTRWPSFSIKYDLITVDWIS